jgi:hypothetical protein
MMPTPSRRQALLNHIEECRQLVQQIRLQAMLTDILNDAFDLSDFFDADSHSSSVSSASSASSIGSSVSSSSTSTTASELEQCLFNWWDINLQATAEEVTLMWKWLLTEV